MIFKVGDVIIPIRYKDEPFRILKINEDSVTLWFIPNNRISPVYWSFKSISDNFVLSKESVWNNEIKEILSEQ